ncbi:MAG: FHA domain-containing protein [Chloroflexi bacterium]|nr:FHA domain-containing protein [Chloroflexota bacterium]
MQEAYNNQTLLARITWDDPQTGMRVEFVLGEGATATIGRLESSDISIREQHVSRQHAVISYRDGVFVIADLGSANGVYVNDVRVIEPYPLVAGDIIRLYVPVLRFDAITDAFDQRQATEHGTLITAVISTGKGKLIVTNGPQEGQNIPLVANTITIGRATAKADWEVSLQDPSVSRPHARMEYRDDSWVVADLGSSNGTLVNGTPINEKGRVVKDGDVLTFGSTVTVFRES